MPNAPKFRLNREAPGSLKGKLRQEILRHIRLGLLRPGDRLPPSRGLADELEVNRGTVSAVYDEMVETGVLSSHVGRGTFVSLEISLDGLGPQDPVNGRFRWRDHFIETEPLPRERTLLAEATAWGKKDVISFAGLVPDESLFPANAFRKALNAVLTEHGGSILSYGPPDGHHAFLEFLRGYLAEQRGVEVGENELLTVNGSQQALDLLGRAFLRPGDTVVVEEPTYYGVLEIFRGYGARLVGVPVDSEGIVVEAMESVLARERPKLVYVMPTFQNPTGGCLSPARREALVRLTARYEIPLVEDDFDGGLYYGSPPPPSLKSYPESRGVIYIGTPSKMLFPGLRIGWIAAPKPVIQHLSHMKQVSDLSGSQLLQAGLTRFAENGGLNKHMKMIRETYGERLQRLLQLLDKHMPKGVTWTRPQGGLSLLITLPENVDSTELLEDAGRVGVLFTPGRLFFVNGGANHVRLSFGTVATPDLEEGVKRLARVFRRGMGRTSRMAGQPSGVSLPPV